MMRAMRVAWFSPLPPARSGVAAYSAELMPRLGSDFTIDAYVDRPGGGAGAAHVYGAHDFVWRHRLAPYDLVVYQLGNARGHDYMWAYLAMYPGLVVLHDARLHHARARQLLQQERFADYRAEFRYDHPDARQDFAEYAVEGLGGVIYYFWAMLRVVMTCARAVAVHNARVASELRDQFPATIVETIRMGVADVACDAASVARARDAVRGEWGLPPDAIVFAAFGKVTAEKRIGALLRAVAALAAEGVQAYALLVGDAEDYPLADELTALGLADRVRVTGYVPDDAIGTYLAAADVCVCLRWPTAQETSASWLRCLAAGRPTLISDLAHLVDVPSDVAWRIDLLDEDRALQQAMRALAADPRRRADLGAAGHAYWARHHTLPLMEEDYRRLLVETAARPDPPRRDLPAHIVADHSAHARSIARAFGLDLDMFAGPTIS
jgi:glycosyltransferase involved in cell wall biosynthesis